MAIATHTTSSGFLLRLLRKKARYAFFLVLLSSCQRPTPFWQVDWLEASPGYASTRILAPVDTPFKELGVEFLITDWYTIMYLNVYSTPLCGDGEDRLIVTIDNGCNKTQTIFNVPMMEGGQRLMVPNWLASEIVYALRCDKPVGICVWRYSRTLEPRDFAEISARIVNL